MDAADIVVPFAVSAWHGPFDGDLSGRAIAALEAGKVLLLPLPFALGPEEAEFLDPAISGDARKNISFDPSTRRLGNAACGEERAARLAAMLERFSDAAWQLVRDLLPSYAPALQRARTSFRPSEIEGRVYSPRHDDKRLHVDAFPSRPIGGKRILRLFTNIAGDGSARHWRVGEPFGGFARAFMPRLSPPLPGSGWLQERLGLTKGRRSAYDHFMLGLHDAVKRDSRYQAEAPRADLYFTPGSTWLCFTDQVLHAALKGHAALEQTFYLPVEAMREPATSPLRTLEKIAGRALV